MNSISDVSKCYHNDVGFCKNGKYCKNTHSEVICEVKICRKTNCEKRHPKSCRYFSDRGYCKFGNYCKYKHSPKINDSKISEQKLKTLEDKIYMLEKVVEEKRNNDLIEKNEIHETKVEMLEKSILSLSNLVNEAFKRIHLLDKEIEAKDHKLSKLKEKLEETQKDIKDSVYDTVEDKFYVVERELEDNIRDTKNMKENMKNIKENLDYCNEKFAETLNIRIYKTHNCAHCHTRIRMLDDAEFKKHMEGVHRIFKCDQCDFKSENERARTIHKKKTHVETK